MIANQTMDGYVQEYVRLLNEISALTFEAEAALGSEALAGVIKAVELHAERLQDEIEEKLLKARHEQTN